MEKLENEFVSPRQETHHFDGRRRDKPLVLDKEAFLGNAPQPSHSVLIKRGAFVTFEGGEGSGKTVQVTALRYWLHRNHINCWWTREPGGTDWAEKVRDLILSEPVPSAEAEALLFYAARLDHMDRIAAQRMHGSIVICDRYVDSTRAYQLVAGANSRLIDTLQTLLVEDKGGMPDLTFIFDIDPDVAVWRRLKRATTQAAPAKSDPFEKRDRDFHLKLRSAYRDIAHANPQRCVLIDASARPEIVTNVIIDRLHERGIVQKT